jgi:hypothetical protein
MKVNDLGRLRHINCPVFEKAQNEGVIAMEFPKIMAGKCVECGVDIDNSDVIPTYQSNDGIFYSVEVKGFFIEVGRER